MNIGLKELREHYGKTSRLFNFMNMLFMLVIAGIGIYVADAMDEADAQSSRIFALYTVFVAGIILTFLLFIGCVMGRKGEYEGAFRIRRVLSLISAFIGSLSLGVTAITVVETYDGIDDEYTKAIFMLQLAASFAVLLFSILMFIESFKGCRYYDGRKNAKDVSDKLTIKKLMGSYTAAMGFSYYVLSLGIFLMAYYFSYEIGVYNEFNLREHSGDETMFFALYIVGTVTGIMVLLPTVAACFVQNKVLNTICKITYLLNTLAQLAFVICSLTVISKSYVKAAHPDSSYIIFSIVLIAIDAVFFVKAESALKKSV